MYVEIPNNDNEAIGFSEDRMELAWNLIVKNIFQ